MYVTDDGRPTSVVTYCKVKGRVDQVKYVLRATSTNVEKQVVLQSSPEDASTYNAVGCIIVQASACVEQVLRTPYFVLRTVLIGGEVLKTH